MRVKWVKDQKVEHHLRSLGIKFDVGIAPIKEIDLKLSQDKQVRLGDKINDDWVMEYAVAMDSGSPFPMCVLNKLKKGYFIWSGNHRTHAAILLEETHIESYLVEVTDPRLSDILPRVVNAWEGRRISREEMLVQAKYLIENHSIETKEAARLLGLKPEWISTYLRGSDVARKITSQGISVNGISRSILTALSPIADNTNVLREVVKLLHDYELAGQSAKNVINDVKEKTTEAQKISEVERWVKILADRNRPTTSEVPLRRATRDKFLRQLTDLSKFLEGKDTLTQLQIVEKVDLKLVEKEWDKIWKAMLKILKGVTA